MKFTPSTSPGWMLRWSPGLWGASWTPRPIRWVWLLCCLLTLVALLVGVWQATQLKAQVENVRSIVVQNELSARPVDPTNASTRATAASAVTPAQADAMNEVVDRLNVPWAHLLNDLEAVTPSTIAVLQIEPLVAASALRWQVEAKSHQAVFAYLDKLSAAKTLKQVRLVKFETNTQDPNRPIRFVLEAALVSVLPANAPATQLSAKSP